jgi:hypothetical protein
MHAMAVRRELVFLFFFFWKFIGSRALKYLLDRKGKRRRRAIFLELSAYFEFSMTTSFSLSFSELVRCQVEGALFRQTLKICLVSFCLVLLFSVFVLSWLVMFVKSTVRAREI